MIKVYDVGMRDLSPRKKNTLFLALAVVTFIPTALPAIVVPFTAFQPSWTQFVFLIGILGNVHVGMTGFFYLGDRRYRSILAGSVLRFFILPLVCVSVAFVLFAWWPKGIWPYFAIHTAWLLVHFGRQNFGLYSFVAAGNRSGAVSSLERAFFSLLPIAAIPKAWTLYSEIGVGPNWVPWLDCLSIGLAAVCVVMLGLMLSRRALWADPQRVTALILGTAFFAPTVVSSNPAIALTFFAHPLQYIIMMLYLAGDRRQGRMAVRFGLLIATGIGLWGLLSYTQSTLTTAFLALSYGLTQAHLLIDAGVWRLRQPAQRAIIADSFDFLFRKPPALPAE